MRPGPLAALDPSSYRDIVRRALAEDACRRDVTTAATVPAGQRATGDLVVKAVCVPAGIDLAVEAFMQLDPGALVERLRRDGDRCASGETLVRITGSAAALLSAERTALNFLQRMSGTATLTRSFVDAAAGRAAIFDTRKTTPTLRTLEKYAVRAGGGTSHRAALDDGILIKDNHIRIAGSLTEAVRRTRAAGRDLPLEVEAQSLPEVDEAVAAGRRHHPARQPAADGSAHGRDPDRRPGAGRGVRRRDARSRGGTGGNRCRPHFGGRPDAFGAGDRLQLRSASGRPQPGRVACGFG